MVMFVRNPGICFNAEGEEEGVAGLEGMKVCTDFSVRVFFDHEIDEARFCYETINMYLCPHHKRFNIQRSLTGVYGRMAGVRLPLGHDNVNTDANQVC